MRILKLGNGRTLLPLQGNFSKDSIGSLNEEVLSDFDQAIREAGEEVS